MYRSLKGGGGATGRSKRKGMMGMGRRRDSLTSDDDDDDEDDDDDDEDTSRREEVTRSGRQVTGSPDVAQKKAQNACVRKCATLWQKCAFSLVNMCKHCN